MCIKISPSVLAGDISRMGEIVVNLTNSGADYIHIDVMDGAFVPEITIGAQAVRALRKYSTLPFDVHLMVQNPQKHIKAFAEAGADIITFHAEATADTVGLINYIHALGKRAGIAISPSSDIGIIDTIYDKIDMVLVMTVNPGYSGQSFMHSQLDKIEAVKRRIEASNRSIELEVDGGINQSTIFECVKRGADVVVAGMYILGSADYAQSIKELREKGMYF